MASIEFDLIADLEARNLVHDSTDREFLRAHVAAGPVGIYYGCDPTADSLHVGNLIGLVTLRRFQDAGHRPIALAGGATGMVGDPSGRSEERNLLDDEVLDHNVACIKEQLGRIVDLDPQESVGDEAGRGRGELVDNRTWTQPITVLEFLRDVGKHVTVNQMLARESIKMRVNSEHGISFTEFSYMLLQANDYLWLHDHLDCTIQIGGSDQWGNIIAGVDLIRRKTGDHVHAFSWPLLTGVRRVEIGQDHRGAGVARRREDQPVPVPAALDADSRRRNRGPTAHVLAPTGGRTARRSLARARATLRSTGSPRRSLADEMVTMVHGADAAHAATEAADLLFSADPVAASAIGARGVRGRDPVVERRRRGPRRSRDDARRDRAGELERRRSTQPRPGLVLRERRHDRRELCLPAEWERLHGRYVLLRKGKKTHHLLEISS